MIPVLTTVLVLSQLCVKGRHVFMGYLMNEEKTKETLDEAGWLRTGDIARIDQVSFSHRSLLRRRSVDSDFTSVHISKGQVHLKP